MRKGSDRLKGALAAGSFNSRWVADLYYNGQRRMANVPITEPDFTDDGVSLVQSTGSCTVVYQGTFADSLSPTDASSILAPFGAELAIYVVIDVGSTFSERVEMGWYRITETPSAEDVTTIFGGRTITVGSTVKLELQDRFEGVQSDGFDTPGSPPQLASTFAEVIRVTSLQLTKEIPDGAIARLIAYQQDRLQYVYDLVQQLDAVPYMRSDGTIGQRPNVWPAAVDTLTDGDTGSLLTVGRAMSSSTVYNRVVIRATSDAQAQILAVAQIDVGPLQAPSSTNARTPFGRRTYYYSSDLITTVAQAQAYAPKLLAQVSSIRTATVPVTEKFNPLREVGDVVTVTRRVGTFTGRILNIHRSDEASQSLTLEVQ